MESKLRLEMSPSWIVRVGPEPSDRVLGEEVRSGETHGQVAAEPEAVWPRAEDTAPPRTPALPGADGQQHICPQSPSPAAAGPRASGPQN